jgi:cation diffusion facilitator CzcD-associated flavoprotein CzcO
MNESPARLNIGTVGGGIGGVAAAVALRRAGIHVTVYERANELREVGGGYDAFPWCGRNWICSNDWRAVNRPNQHLLVRSAAPARILTIRKPWRAFRNPFSTKIDADAA